MQLKNKNKKAISIALAAATSSLLANAAVGEENDVGWEIDTSVLYYGEQDDRVEDTSLALRIARRFEDGRAFVAGLSTDSLTGASPTGAVPLNEPQTFTRPSARGQYVTQPGEIPLDDSFKDSRVAGYVSWTQPFGENWTANVGASFSTEYDYEHLGFNASLARDFNNKNTTVAAGFAYAQDELDPEGGAPMPLSEMRGVGDTSNKLSGTQDKSVTDLLIGVTQILNERMLLQVNYSFSQSDDYHNDPFKFLTVLASSGAPVVGPDGLYSYRFESRPDERTKHSLFTKLKTYIGGGALDTSYRFMTDDWGINSHTLDMRYRFNISERNYIEPHLRFYQQSEADFYQANLIAGDTVPNEASADYRLAEFTGTTFGVKVGHKFNNGNEASARLEWYNQDGTAKLAGVPGGANVFPELDAVIFQVSYRFHL
ncbi:MAG: DUF3570 domain-containing protein [Pseudomonadaceae bacterium]|nr:DUF3570 domain-containing protein [Pseudomonadaceae bacterium]